MALERGLHPRLVEVTKGDIRAREEVEGLPGSLAAKLGERLGLRAPARGPESDVHPALRALRAQAKRRGVVGNLDDQQLVLAVRDGIHLGQQLRLDAVADPAGETFLLTQRIRDADNRAVVVEADHDGAARRIRKRHDVLQDRLRGGQIPLEVQTRTLPSCYRVSDLHARIFSASPLIEDERMHGAGPPDHQRAPPTDSCSISSSQCSTAERR